MSDIFISYARADEEAAERLARTLQEQGLDIWWDRTIPPGSTWATVIKQALDDAACVMVLWSDASAESGNVREEAEYGKGLGKLVPVFLSRVDPPFGFGSIEAANLADWEGEADHEEFQQLIQVLEEKVAEWKARPAPEPESDEASPGVDPVPPAPAADTPVKTDSGPGRASKRRRALAAVGAVVAVLAATAGVFRDPLIRTVSPHVRSVQTQLDTLRFSYRPPMEDVYTAGNAEMLDRLLSFRDAHKVHARDFRADDLGFLDESIGKLEAAKAVEDERRARARWQVTDQLWDDPTQPAGALLDSLEALIAEDSDNLSSEVMLDVGARRQSLGDFVRRYDEAMAAADTLPIWEARPVLSSFLGGQHPRTAPELDSASAALVDLDQTWEGGSILTGPDKLKTCLRVDNSNCVGERREFSTGDQVWVWTRVRVYDSRDDITLEWTTEDGGIESDGPHRVSQNRSDGYRVGVARTYAQPGTYQVRVYNGDTQLIGKATFTVGS